MVYLTPVKPLSGGEQFLFGQIEISDLNNQKIYSKKVNSIDEANEFLNDYGQPIESYGIIKQLFLPMRTQGLGLCQDLFFPTLINLAIQVDNIALRILASLVAIPIDLLTFIPRLLLTPFRLITSNMYPFPSHPLVRDGLIDEENERVIIKIEVKREVFGGMFASRVQNTNEYIHEIAIQQYPLLEYKYEEYATLDSRWHNQPRFCCRRRKEVS